MTITVERTTSPLTLFYVMLRNDDKTMRMGTFHTVKAASIYAEELADILTVKAKFQYA